MNSLAVDGMSRLFNPWGAAVFRTEADRDEADRLTRELYQLIQDIQSVTSFVAAYRGSGYRGVRTLRAYEAPEALQPNKKRIINLVTLAALYIHHFGPTGPASSPGGVSDLEDLLKQYIDHLIWCARARCIPLTGLEGPRPDAAAELADTEFRRILS